MTRDAGALALEGARRPHYTILSRRYTKRVRSRVHSLDVRTRTRHLAPSLRFELDAAAGSFTFPNHTSTSSEQHVVVVRNATSLFSKTRDTRTSSSRTTRRRRAARPPRHAGANHSSRSPPYPPTRARDSRSASTPTHESTVHRRRRLSLPARARTNSSVASSFPKNGRSVSYVANARAAVFTCVDSTFRARGARTIPRRRVPRRETRCETR